MSTWIAHNNNNNKTQNNKTSICPHGKDEMDVVTIKKYL